MDFATIFQAMAALASPLMLWLIKEVRDWKSTTDTRVERNTAASWGSSDPHNEWPGTVELSKSNRNRSKENRERVDDTVERLEYVEGEIEEVEDGLEEVEERVDVVEDELAAGAP